MCYQVRYRHQICQVYGDNAMGDGMVRKWFRMFNEGRENVHDEAWSGRPSLVNDDLVHKVNERVHDDTFHNFWSVPALSSDFKDSMTLSVVIWVVRKCVHDGCPRCSQRTTKNSVLHVLWHFWCVIWHVEPYCDRRRDMGVPYHTWIKKAVLALEAYWLAKKEKVQADNFNKEDHVHRILGQTRCSLGRIFAPRHNNKLCCLLWNAEEAEACNSKQKARNAESHHFASW